MDVSRIGQQSPLLAASSLSSPPAATSQASSGDSFSYTISSSPANLPPSGATFRMDACAQAEGSPQGTVYCLTTDGVRPLHQQSDGGIMVDEETKTVAYYGDAARMFLEKTRDFDRETEVILPTQSTLTIDCEGERLSLGEPGALLIGPGARAQVRTEGKPLVIQTEKSPSWYAKMGPTGEHQDDFDSIASKNQKLFKCLTNKSLFDTGELQQLLSFGVLSTYKDDSALAAWAPFKNPDELVNKLIELGFKGSSIEQIEKIWENAMKRKLYGMETGHFPRERLTKESLRKLTSRGIIRDFGGWDRNVYWTEVANDDHMKIRLGGAGLRGKDLDDVLALWRSSTKSGYDNTGLCWDKGKVVAYILRDKQNVWNEHDTEWIVNSTEYAGENQPFTVGVSTVAAKKPCAGPVDFRELRPGEGLHMHPIREGRKQTEAYLVTGGKAAILTLRKGKPQVTYLEAGDMAIVNPGVLHSVIAADGPYEHLCFQVPSAFQYGFLFKHINTYESCSLDEKKLIEEAKKGLSEGKKGTYEI
jgi:hypothetical protein